MKVSRIVLSFFINLPIAKQLALIFSKYSLILNFIWIKKIKLITIDNIMQIFKGDKFHETLTPNTYIMQ